MYETKIKLIKALLGVKEFNGFVEVADELYPNNKLMHDKLICELGEYFIKNPNAKGIQIIISK